MAASSFTSVSLAPPLVSVCVANTSTTWPKLATLGRLGLSVLAGDHAPIAKALAAKYGDRFGSVDWMATDSGAVFVHGATLWLECAPFKRIEAGDHEIVVLQIVVAGDVPGRRPDGVPPQQLPRAGADRLSCPIRPV